MTADQLRAVYREIMSSALSQENKSNTDLLPLAEMKHP